MDKVDKIDKEKHLRSVKFAPEMDVITAYSVN